jgi:integrase/recombinase XerD
MTGLREQELSTLRRIDCVLDGSTPVVRITERPEYKFVPKAYEIRDVPVPETLLVTLRAWLQTHDHKLVFPTRRGKVDGHLLRRCQSVAWRAGFDPEQWWLHKFRATYATVSLRKTGDLETVRSWLGQLDTESLRRYLKPLELAGQKELVNKIWEKPGLKLVTPAA